MQELKTTFSYYYPDGVIGGQCAVFAEKLEQFGPVGNTLATKTAYVKKHGILFNALNGHFEIGDVVILDAGTLEGHVFIVNDLINNQLQATESNWKLDQRVHHTRLVPVSNKIVGVLRGCPLKVQIKPMTFKLKLVANNINWSTLQVKIDQLKSRILSGSSNRLQLTVTVQNTNFVNIPYESYGSGLTGVSRGWFKANISPLGAGFDGVMLLIDLADYQGSQGIDGYSYFDDASPQEIQIAADEHMTSGGQGNPDLPMFVEFAEHELDHTLRQMTGQETPTDNPNLVHDYIAKGRFNDILGTVDYAKLETLINKIMSNAQFVHKSGTSEYGFYFPKLNVDALKDMALNVGQNIEKPDGSVDFDKAKTVSGL